MARINLLPWRAERRALRLKAFYSMLGAAGVAALLISVLIVMYYNAQIEDQNQRNQYLRDQIAIVDRQIEEISKLDKKKAGLLKRKEVIEELQASRSQMVHLFDELVRTLADGIMVTSIQQNGAELTLTGRAQSNARVATYSRKFEASGWMTNPEVNVIEAKGNDKGLPYEFSLKVTLKNPNDVKTGETGAATTSATDAAAVPASATTAPPVAAPSTIPAPPAAPTAAPPAAAASVTPPSTQASPTAASTAPANAPPPNAAPAQGGKL
jgi:type IV pilus assembly protein PilN